MAKLKIQQPENIKVDVLFIATNAFKMFVIP